jgi:hypothetical protein
MFAANMLLEVKRHGMQVASGSLAELIQLAEAGKLQAGDLVFGLEATGSR